MSILRSNMKLIVALAVIIASIVVIQQLLPPAGPNALGGSLPAGNGGERGSLAPDLQGVSGWVNTEPLSLRDLEGQVVLIDFWTYSCVNCINTLPYLKQWQDKYAGQGLVMIGVHTPEFEFEKEITNVRDAVQQLGITWPVAQDNEYQTWRAYRNRYWPRKYLIDSTGVVRYDHIGEGGYVETEQQIRTLLTEAGHDVLDIPTGNVAPPPSFNARITRELYAGFHWAERGSLGHLPVSRDGNVSVFEDPGDHEEGFLYFDGTWREFGESMQAVVDSDDPGALPYVAVRFRARSANAVIRPEGEEPFDVELLLHDGPLPEALAGDDVVYDEQGRSILVVDGPRMYNLVRNGPPEELELRLVPESSAFNLYTFAFSPH